MKRNESMDSFTQIIYPESQDESDSNGNPTPSQKPSISSSAPGSPLSQHSLNSNKDGQNSSNSSDNWKISLNQFLANSVAVPLINEYFDCRTSLKEGVERMQKNRRKCILPNYY